MAVTVAELLRREGRAPVAAHRWAGVEVHWVRTAVAAGTLLTAGAVAGTTMLPAPPDTPRPPRARPAPPDAAGGLLADGDRATVVDAAARSGRAPDPGSAAPTGWSEVAFPPAAMARADGPTISGSARRGAAVVPVADPADSADDESDGDDRDDGEERDDRGSDRADTDDRDTDTDDPADAATGRDHPVRVVVSVPDLVDAVIRVDRARAPRIEVRREAVAAASRLSVTATVDHAPRSADRNRSEKIEKRFRDAALSALDSRAERRLVQTSRRSDAQRDSS